MGKTYKELKNKIGQLRFENSFLTSKVEKVLLENGKVKRELQVSNARIVELAQELHLLKNGLLFVDEAKEDLRKNDNFIFAMSLTTADIKDVPFDINGFEKFKKGVEKRKQVVSECVNNPPKREEKAFSSRFMPNVKFKISGHRQELEDALLPMMMFADFGKINSDGSFTGSASAPELFKLWGQKEVSIYEAIPELVPDGMVYDKESDSLIKKDIR